MVLGGVADLQSICWRRLLGVVIARWSMLWTCNVEIGMLDVLGAPRVCAQLFWPLIEFLFKSAVEDRLGLDSELAAWALNVIISSSLFLKSLLFDKVF